MWSQGKVLGLRHRKLARSFKLVPVTMLGFELGWVANEEFLISWSYYKDQEPDYAPGD